jgi:hypothetical protein
MERHLITEDHLVHNRVINQFSQELATEVTHRHFFRGFQFLQNL